MNDPAANRRDVPLPVARREIRRWDTSGGDVVMIELQDYAGGRRAIALRRWYRDALSGELRPGRAGISFPLADLDELENAVETLRMISPRPVGPTDDPEPFEQDEVTIEQTSQAIRPPRSPFPRLRTPRPASVSSDVLAGIAAAGSEPNPAPAPAAAAIPTPSPAPSRQEPLLAAIFTMGLVAAPLALRLDVGPTVMTGAAYADGSLVFGNRRFANPREAVSVLCNKKHVIDGWHSIRYRNPKTQRFARLSRLRGLYQGLSEAADADKQAD